jgi:hypothetical protein
MPGGEALIIVDALMAPVCATLDLVSISSDEA